MCIVITIHVSGQLALPYEGVLVDRYVVHRHIMCVVIHMYLDTLLARGGGREARVGALAPATRHAPAYMPFDFYFTLVPGTA